MRTPHFPYALFIPYDPPPLELLSSSSSLCPTHTCLLSSFNKYMTSTLMHCCLMPSPYVCNPKVDDLVHINQIHAINLLTHLLYYHFRYSTFNSKLISWRTSSVTSFVHSSIHSLTVRSLFVQIGIITTSFAYYTKVSSPNFRTLNETRHCNMPLPLRISSIAWWKFQPYATTSRISITSIPSPYLHSEEVILIPLSTLANPLLPSSIQEQQQSNASSSSYGPLLRYRCRSNHQYSNYNSVILEQHMALWYVYTYLANAWKHLILPSQTHVCNFSNMFATRLNSQLFFSRI